MKALFVTGTDTGIGKTYVSTLLLRQLNKSGYKTFGIKPIATGCKKDANGNLINDDALALQSASSLYQPYPVVNPIAFKDPIAPHLAAQKANITLSAKSLSETILSSIQPHADLNLIEGIGGWSVPLNDDELISEAITQLNLPVLLVVGIKLGCLNHAITTSQNIVHMKIPFLGWIANYIEPNTLMPKENILTLKKRLPAPCLGIVPYQSSENLNIEQILKNV